LLLNISSSEWITEGCHLRTRLRKLFKDDPAAESLAVYSAFDIVGDIAITKMPPATLLNAAVVAEAIMERHKNVKTVLLQKGGVTGDYRLRKLKHIAGEKRTSTVHKESGCTFKVDVDECYFSPRLSGERLRVAKLVKSGETVVNMFAGIGCFSILIAKSQPTVRVYSIDINPAAVGLMEENIRLNRVFGTVIPLLGDAAEVIRTRLAHCADHVLMPLPEKAFEYMPTAVEALKLTGGWIHVHAFERASKAESAMFNVRTRIGDVLNPLRANFEFGLVREVRSVGPNRFQIVADLHVTPSRSGCFVP